MTAAGWVWVAVAAILAVLDWAAVAARVKLLERCAKPAVLLALLAAALTAHPSHAGVHGWLLLALGFGLVGDVALSFASPGQLPAPRRAQPDAAGGSQPEVAGETQPEVASLSQPDGPHTGIQAQLDELLTSPPPSPVGAAARPAAGAHRAGRTRRSARLAERAEPVGLVEPATAAGPAAATGTQPPDVLFSAGLASFLLGHLCYCAAMLRYGTDQLSLGFGLVLVLLALLAFGQRVLAGAQAQGGTGLTVAVAAYITALGSAVVLGIGTSSLRVAYGIVLFACSDLVLASDRFVRRLLWAPVTVAVTYHLAQALLVLGLAH
ncbi:lysoplasmalogenase [Jatrophihabitans sp.]|uniref:lysoplasmalogenase n=1 Tax=Jatrophihabitans sp. TaxID=1932789 RepID=UPI002B727B9E|nr:lysoplasmalogenase [Jatrophihabitans sp.]